jgi:hypothetical protein
MIRTTVGALTFLLAPAFLGAQEPSGMPAGESGGAAAPPGTVVRIELVGQEPLRPDPGSYLARREFLSYRRFEAGSVPEIPIGERTVFFEAPGSELLVSTVVIQPPEEVSALPAAIFHAAGWIIPEGSVPDRFGEVVGFRGTGDAGSERSTVRPFDLVRIRFSAEGAPAVGDEFLLYRLPRILPGVGHVAVPTGRVRVTGMGADGVDAQLIVSYGRAELGDFVSRPRFFPLSPGAHPLPTEVSVEATLIAFQEQKELYLPGDFAFLDRGAEDGLAIGDEMVAVVGRDGGWPGHRVARFQLVGVRENDSTARLLSTESPTDLRPGLELILDLRMP